MVHLRIIAFGQTRCQNYSDRGQRRSEIEAGNGDQQKQNRQNFDVKPVHFY